PRSDHDHAADGRAHGPEGVRGGRARRHRQHPRRRRRRPRDRPRRTAHRRLPLARLPRRDHVRDLDRDPGTEAGRAARRGSSGEGVMAGAKAAGTPGSAEMPKKPRWPLRALGFALALAAIYGAGAAAEAGLIEYVQRIVLLAGINVILAVG